MLDRSICTIIVAFNSKIERLEKLLSILASESLVTICDNSTDRDIQLMISLLAHQFHVNYLSMNGNVGIAAAQNSGLDIAKRLDCKFVFLLDDDSMPDPHLLVGLVEAYHRLSKSGIKVGAVGARARDSSGADISNSNQYGDVTSTCSQMMSSGALIPIDVINDIGMMDESLFIDCVDFDWGWRAIEKGYGLYLCANCYLQHSLGQAYFSFGRLKFGIPAPIRHYYQYRNILKMMSRTYVPMTWKIKQSISLVLKFIVFPLFVAPRTMRLKYIVMGIEGWIHGSVGKCPSEMR